MNQTAHKILDLAEFLTQTRGFDGFSYRDLQASLGIKTSSIHYYFPTKNDLAKSMLNRHIARIQEKLTEISQSSNSTYQKLALLGDVFFKSAQEGKFCLCGMLASHTQSLPVEVQELLRHFFDLTQEWIVQTLEPDHREGLNPQRWAAHYLSALQGALLIAFTRQDPSYLSRVIETALDSLSLPRFPSNSPLNFSKYSS